MGTFTSSRGKTRTHQRTLSRDISLDREAICGVLPAAIDEVQRHLAKMTEAADVEMDQKVCIRGDELARKRIRAHRVQEEHHTN